MSLVNGTAPESKDSAEKFVNDVNQGGGAEVNSSVLPSSSSSSSSEQSSGEQKPVSWDTFTEEAKKLDAESNKPLEQQQMPLSK